jgi:signal transduction histidine kinase
MDLYALAHRMPVVIGARFVMIALCLGLTVIAEPAGGELLAAGMLVVVAVAASLPWGPRVAPFVPFAEGVLAAAVIAGSTPLNQALLPYLIVPVLGSGLARGLRGALITATMSGLVLIGARATTFNDPNGLDDLAAIAQWLVAAVAIGLVAGWARRIQQRPVDPDVAAYESAYRLLNQLRTVSRQLSIGLDQVTLADSMLDDVLISLPAERGAVFAIGEGTTFSPLSTRGVRPELWSPRASDGSAWARALREGTGQTQAGGLGLASTPDVVSAVIPVRVGSRTIAVIGVERNGEPFAEADLDVATHWASDYAIRLDTALLFAEVRTIATAEERRRLAREIHDGVAQELASLGYRIDDLAASASTPSIKQGLADLRLEVTRVITELRLSIFDLRSEVTAGVTLTTALADYIRSMGPALGAEIHLSTQESGARLRFDTEAELLRIAQEALTNCRRHADASNIWVSTTIAAPEFELVVEDDGQGLGDGRSDSFGMEIMRERAARIGASIQVADGPRGGTMVRVASREPAPEPSDPGQTVGHSSGALRT